MPAMTPFTIPTTTAADELEYLRCLRSERAIAAIVQDTDLVGDLDVDIEATLDAIVGLAVTEIATLRGELGARGQG
jgi:hypothetical protein